MGADIQFLSRGLCLLDEGLAQGDDAADQSLDLLAHGLGVLALVP